MWSVAGDADEPGTGFPIPNLLVCPAKPIFVARPLAQQHNKQCCLPPSLPLLAAVLNTSLKPAVIRLHLQICFDT